MGLDGVNKKCAGCIEDCKQFKQVTVVFCPKFAKVEEMHLDTQGKIAESPKVER